MSRTRTVLLGVCVGACVAVAAATVAFCIVAIPLFVLGASSEGGLDRDAVRIGLFAVALPLGAVAGVVSGVWAGRWYGRGGRLPTGRDPDGTPIAR
ncbi:MAG: hypothetical protein ACT452_17135 [Microthrixaceae bacterium]